jgi:FkbM family methyltransferase
MKTKLRYLYRAYRYRYRVDTAELRFLRASLRLGQVAVDIGCHKGAYTYWMRRRVGAAGKVFAFEPQPRQVAYLRTAFSSLPFENVVLVPVALSDKVGRARLHVPTGAGMTHAASLEQVGAASRAEPNPPRLSESTLERSAVLEVDVTTLDAYFAEELRGPAFLKIDVEGHELSVLRGGRDTLGRYRPTLLVGTFFQNGNRRPLDEFDPAIHQRLDPSSDHLPRGYVNNFAFVPGE